MEKLMKMKVVGSHNAVILPFYTVINSFRMKHKKTNIPKVKKKYKDAIKNLQVSPLLPNASHS